MIKVGTPRRGVRPTIGSDVPAARPYLIDNPKLSAYNSPMALTLSKNRMLGGVCGGLAEWLGWDPTLVRILYTLLTIFTAFSGLIVYLVLWIIMPRRT